MRKIGVYVCLLCVLAAGCGKTEEKSGTVSSGAVTAGVASGEAAADEAAGKKNEAVFTVAEYQGGVRIDGCENVPEELVIPETIDGREVVGIGTYAFAQSGLRRVTIPKGVRFIGERAFLECGQLEEVDIKGVGVQMQEAAFVDCPRLRTVTKPKESKTIVFIGNSLTSYPYMASHMQAILKKTGRTEYNVMSNIRGGRALDGHLEDCDRSGLNAALAMADIVVMQDMDIEPGHCRYIREIYDRCRKDVKLYYVLTNWMEKEWRDVYAKYFQGYLGLDVLDTGNVFDKIVESGIYKPKELAVKEDEHPNCLAGYFYTLYVYHKIWKRDVTVFKDLDYLHPDVKKWFTTPSAKEEMKKVEKVQKMINSMS